MDRRNKTTRYGRERPEATTRRESGAAARRRSGSQVRRPSGSAHQILPSGLYKVIDDDPLYQVVTSDGRHWVHPFTGEVHLVEGSVGDTARRQLAADPTSWRGAEPLPHGELMVLRWRHELSANVGNDDRLRMFSRSGRGWLNPFSGRFHGEIERSEGLITQRTIQAMARALAVDPLAQRGVMMSRDQLLARIKLEEGAEAGRKTATGLLEPGEDEQQEPTPLENDLSKARDVQTRIQGTMPPIEGYDLGVHFAPQHEVSGDFYDAIPLDDQRVLLFVGDVTGHGMQAALVAATALKAIRLLVAQSWRGDLVGLICALNENVKPDLMAGQFITLFAAVLDRQQHRMEVVLAGHHQAAMANLKQLRVQPVGRKGAAIGILPSATLQRVLTPEQVAIAPGDVLLQYTDGVTEAINREGEEFGLHRLLGAAFTHAGGSMRGLCDGVAAARGEFEGPTAADDVTVLALKRLADGTAPLG